MKTHRERPLPKEWQEAAEEFVRLNNKLSNPFTPTREKIRIRNLFCTHPIYSKIYVSPLLGMGD